MWKCDESPETGGNKQKTEPGSRVNLMLSLHNAEKQRKKAIVPYENTAVRNRVFGNYLIIISNCKPEQKAKVYFQLRKAT